MKKVFGILVSLVVMALFTYGCGGGSGDGSGGAAAVDQPASTEVTYSASDLAGTWTIAGSQHAVRVTFNTKGDITSIVNAGGFDLTTFAGVQPYSSTRFGVKANGSVSGREYFYDPGKNTVTWTVVFQSKTVMKGVITWVCPADGWDKKYSVTVTKK